VNSRSS